tara:strand:- start:1236 stop:1727 length:492 start_codon:yes stop_codon:yes gene_type:complete
MTRFLMIAALAFSLPVGPASALGQSPQAIAPGPQTEVTAVLRGYREAIEALDAEAGSAFFWADGRVYEQGGVEGTYGDYLAHHLGPELTAFSAFSFNDYDSQVAVVGDIAYATETYVYRIAFKDTARPAVERRGVATSVLERRGGVWRIVSYHSSARAPRPAA